MARAGWFDETGIALGWFDETAQSGGWFDETTLDPASAGATITGTLAATEAQDAASFTGTVPSHETPVAGGGGGSKSRVARTTRLLVTLNGKDHVITVDQLPGFLEYAKTQIDPKPVKVKKKKGKKRLVIEQEAPQIVIKSVPQYALPEVRKVIDRTNEIMAILWERALMTYINELEDEEALILALTL